MDMSEVEKIEDIISQISFEESFNSDANPENDEIEPIDDSIGKAYDDYDQYSKESVTERRLAIMAREDAMFKDNKISLMKQTYLSEANKLGLTPVYVNGNDGKETNELCLNFDHYRNRISKEQDEEIVKFLKKYGKKITVAKVPCAYYCPYYLDIFISYQMIDSRHLRYKIMYPNKEQYSNIYKICSIKSFTYMEVNDAVIPLYRYDDYKENYLKQSDNPPGAMKIENESIPKHASIISIIREVIGHFSQLTCLLFCKTLDCRSEKHPKIYDISEFRYDSKDDPLSDKRNNKFSNSDVDKVIMELRKTNLNKVLLDNCNNYIPLVRIKWNNHQQDKELYESKILDMGVNDYLKNKLIFYSFI